MHIQKKVSSGWAVEKSAIRIAAIFGTAAAIFVFGFVAAMLYLHGPTESDLRKFDWDGVSAAMSFISAVATFAAVVAALRIAGSEAGERARRVDEATTILVRIVLVEVIAVRSEVRALREVFSQADGASNELCKNSFEALANQISARLVQPSIDSIRPQLLEIRGLEAASIAHCYSIVQQIRHNAAYIQNARVKRENWGRSAFDSLRLLTISAQQVCNITFEHCWKVASPGIEIPERSGYEVTPEEYKFQRDYSKQNK